MHLEQIMVVRDASAASMPRTFRKGDGRRPDVSVIVACYNVAGTLADTLTSVQEQTHTNWEVVCVDDGSTDGTPEMLATFAGADSRIRWTRTAHHGPAAKNSGLSLARADRVLCLDADDVLRPDALEVLLFASNAAGKRVIVAGGRELLDCRGRSLSIYYFPVIREFSVDELLRSNPLSLVALVPVSLLGVKPFDENLLACIDWDLWLRLAHAGGKCIIVPRVIFGYRMHSGNLSRKTDQVYAFGRRVLERWLPEARDSVGVRDVLHRWAWACGALALTLGSGDSVRRYFEGLPPLDEPTEGFHLAAAGSLHWAFTFTHGAVGETWRDHARRWSVEIKVWLEDGPLAGHAEMIFECLRQIVKDPRDAAETLLDFLDRRVDAGRLLVYGLGTNGVSLLQHLRDHPDPPAVELCVADDLAAPLTFSMIGLPCDDPRRWDRWPDNTVAVITPNDFEAMRKTLLSAGGREGIDFIALAGPGKRQNVKTPKRRNTAFNRNPAGVRVETPKRLTATSGGSRPRRSCEGNRR
jgi:hypothetical protein